MLYYEHEDSKTIAPFGPPVFQTDISEESSEFLLESIEDQIFFFKEHNKNNLKTHVVHSEKTITNGEISAIDRTMQIKYHENLAEKLIVETSERVYKNYLKKIIELYNDENLNELLNPIPLANQKILHKNLDIELNVGNAYLNEYFYTIMRLDDYFDNYKTHKRTSFLNGIICLQTSDYEYPNGILNLHNVSGNNTLSSNIFKIKLKKNAVYFWPSWLTYSITPNKSESNSILLHFDISWGFKNDIQQM